MDKVEDGLQQIHEAIVKYILEFLKTGVFRNKTTNSFMIAYSQVHKLADDEHESSKRLFDYYITTITTYLKESVEKIKTEEGEALIDAFIREYNQAKILIHWMRKVFTYLDKFYTKNQSIGSLCTNAMNELHDILFQPLMDRLFTVVTNIIKEDRDGMVVQRYKIKNILRIFEDIDMKNPDLVKTKDDLYWTGTHVFGVINNWFKDHFLVATELYISQKSARFIASYSAPEYIKEAMKYLDEEDNRKSEYIMQKNNFHERINQVNLKYMVENNAKTIAKMDTGIRFMFKNKKDVELKEAYKLISKHPDSLKTITEELDPFVRERGEELYNNRDLAKDPVKFIPELIKLKRELDSLIEFAFDNHILFQDTKNKAFSHFMNKEHYSKQLSNFCDYEMKLGIKGKNNTQIEEKLNDIINLFKCLNNKLIFQIEYAKKLSDRLIQAKSLSQIAEKSLISKLKAEAGVTYVNKMTSMMQDLETSKTEIDLYRASKHRGSPNGIYFNVQVLQHGAWEIDKIKFDAFEYPSFLTKCMEDFNSFYINRHKTHKLSWALGLGSMEIQYLYLQKPYISITTLMQFSLLIILEKYEKLKIEKISEIMGCNPLLLANEANALLYHMSYNPKKLKTNGIILSDAGEKEDLKPKNEVYINKEFAANSLKINTIPAVFRVS